MALTLGWEWLFDQVVASFLADGIACEQTFGWRTVRKHVLGRARIAWVPGDPADTIGTTTAPRTSAAMPVRSLATLGELFTVYISHQDPAAPENERRQYHLTRLLRDAWWRAVYRTAHGVVAIRAESWLPGDVERRHGATLRLTCELQAPVLDMVADELLAPGTPEGGVVDAVAAAAAEGATVEAQIDVDTRTTSEPGDEGTRT